MSEERVSTEEIKVSGDSLVAKVKEIIHEGNIRRITVQNEEGKGLVVEKSLVLHPERSELFLELFRAEELFQFLVDALLGDGFQNVEHGYRVFGFCF